MAIGARKTSSVLLQLFALFLLGTVVFLAVVRAYFHVDASAYVLASELGTYNEIRSGVERPAVLANHSAPADADQPRSQIPKVIHQTWKTEELPERWRASRQQCMDLHPDYEHILWTDAKSRAFIAEHYSWFLPTFDAYPYAIQRADAIRYFVLHRYGGIYMDLDMGCARNLDPLLRFEVVLPKTIPVGVSNDLIFATKGHPFVEQLIHSLQAFNHVFFTHYATVMFSTGPMFVSAVYRRYVDAHKPASPSSPSHPDAGFTGLRVLPKSLYGKNARPGETPDSFFLHFYGSSWHASDAGFLIFLRIYGRLLIALGILLVLYARFRAPIARLLAPVLSTVWQWVWRLLRACWSLGNSGPALDAGSDSPSRSDSPFTLAHRQPSDKDCEMSAVGALTHGVDGEAHVPLLPQGSSPLPTDPSPPSSNGPSSAELYDMPFGAAPAMGEQRELLAPPVGSAYNVPLSVPSRPGSSNEQTLGAYSKRVSKRPSHEDTSQLPAYYVDSGSEYALSDAASTSSRVADESPDPVWQRPESGRLRRFKDVMWRSWTPTLATVVPPALRNARGRFRSMGLADDTSVLADETTPSMGHPRRASAEPSSTRLNSINIVHSGDEPGTVDDYAYDWARLRDSYPQGPLVSPPLRPHLSPSPVPVPTSIFDDESLPRSQSQSSPHHATAGLLRRPVQGPSRAATPAVYAGPEPEPREGPARNLLAEIPPRATRNV